MVKKTYTRGVADSRGFSIANTGLNKRHLYDKEDNLRRKFIYEHNYEILGEFFRLQNKYPNKSKKHLHQKALINIMKKYR